MARWFTYPTLDPLDPGSGQKTEVRIPGDYVEYLNKCRPVDFYNLRTLAKVLDVPKRIFHGIRAESEGGWCYVGKPDQWWIKEGVEVPFPKHLVFAIYLREISNSLTVFTFRAEYADDKDPLSPRNWDERYERLVWKSKG